MVRLQKELWRRFFLNLVACGVAAAMGASVSSFVIWQVEPRRALTRKIATIHPMRRCAVWTPQSDQSGGCTHWIVESE
jgi:hypothetical protein